MRKLCISIYTSALPPTCFSVARSVDLGIAKNLTNNWRVYP